MRIGRREHCPAEVDREGCHTGFLPLKGLSDSHISKLQANTMTWMTKDFLFARETALSRALKRLGFLAAQLGSRRGEPRCVHSIALKGGGEEGVGATSRVGRIGRVDQLM